MSIALIYLPLLFPTGGLAPLAAGWRRGAAGRLVVAFSVALAFEPGPIQQAAFIDNPFGVGGMGIETYATVIIGPSSLLFVVPIVLSLASLVLRFTRTTGDARLQIKWFALATLIAGAAFGVYLAASLAFIDPAGIKVPRGGGRRRPDQCPDGGRDGHPSLPPVRHRQTRQPGSRMA